SDVYLCWVPACNLPGLAGPAGSSFQVIRYLEAVDLGTSGVVLSVLSPSCLSVLMLPASVT
ncbi:hypothetical protein KUCAC02_027994, partial [Chaenocephalus aceratus]